MLLWLPEWLHRSIEVPVKKYNQVDQSVKDIEKIIFLYRIIKCIQLNRNSTEIIIAGIFIIWEVYIEIRQKCVHFTLQ